MNNLLKYLSIYKAFFKASFAADIEYRLNFVFLIIAEFVWYSTQLILFEVLYRHTNVIGDWNLQQMRVFIFLALFVDSIYMILWDQNFLAFNDNVRKGTLDLLLMKPIDSMFMLSSQRISISHIPCFFITAAGCIWSLAQLPDFNWLKLLWLIFLVPAGLSVIFCGRFALNCTAILFTRADFLQYVWFSLFRLGLRPDAIYSGFLRIILIFVVPFAMVASIPARILLEPTQYWMIAWGIVLPFILVTLLKKYWRYCLSQYSSASS
ncbi:MAG: ABC-2 family transporter protein [Bdellovibrio sp.]|nr:ABC-2 family transporter protein [Bdellovibrio sp.]